MTSVYDQLNQAGPDFGYWLRLAARAAPGELCDLGCGTGQLTVLFARAGHRVTGVDPDPAMLAVARTRPGHDLVTWVDGTAADLPSAGTGLITMTGHVAQVFRTDRDWAALLADVRRVLRPGGRVAFDMRNPAARAWEQWNPADSRRTVATAHGPAEVWHRVTAVRDDLVSFTTTTRYAGTRDQEVVHDTLRFRDEAALRRSLTAAGLPVERVDGDWDGTPAGATAPELLVTAVRA